MDRCPSREGRIRILALISAVSAEGSFVSKGSHGLLTSAFASGYSAEFQDFKDFEGKRVGRLILIDPEPGHDDSGQNYGTK